MAVERFHALTVIDHDRIAVAGHPVGVGDNAGSRRMDRRVIVHAQVDAAMVSRRTGNRVNAPAKFRRDDKFSFDRVRHRPFK